MCCILYRKTFCNLFQHKTEYIYMYILYTNIESKYDATDLGQVFRIAIRRRSIAHQDVCATMNTMTQTETVNDCDGRAVSKISKASFESILGKSFGPACFQVERPGSKRGHFDFHSVTWQQITKTPTTCHTARCARRTRHLDCPAAKWMWRP